MSACAWDSKFAGQNQHKTSVGDEQKDREKQNRARLKELQFQLQSEDEKRISNDAAKISTFHQMGETEKILQQIFTTYAHTPLATWDFAAASGSSDSVPFEEAEHLTDGKKANNMLILSPTPPLRPPPSFRKKSADSVDRMNGNRHTVQQSLLFASKQSDIAHHSAKQEPAERNINKVEVVKRIERLTSRPTSGGFKGQTNKALSATKSMNDAGDDEDRSIKSAGTSRSRNSTNSRTTYRTTATDVLVDGDGDSLKTNKIFGNGDKDSAIGSNKTQSHVKSSGYGQNVSRAFKKKSALSTSVSGGFRTNPSPFKTTGKGLDNNTFDIMKSDDEDEYDRLMIDLNNVDVLEMTATEDERERNEEAASRNSSGRMVLSRDQMSSQSPPKPIVHNDCEKELTSVPKSSPSSLSNTKSSRTKDIGNQVTVTGPSVEQTSNECMAAAMKQLDNAININQQKMTSHKAVPTISVHFLLSALAQRLSERRHQKGEKSPHRRREQIKVTPGLQTGTDNVSPSASPTTNNYLIYHTPNLDYQVFYDDWINSDIVLDALDNEQDDLGDRISSFVLSLSDVSITLCVFTLFYLPV
jgi:hypothetical protein